MTTFVPGATLSRRLYGEVVRPLLDAQVPGLPHAAALLGRGSEVLGFDDETSTDHDWKPRVLLFLTEDDEARHGADVRDALLRGMPTAFAGRPAGHEVTTVRAYLQDTFALDPDGPVTVRDWLTLPEHGLRAFVAGPVFHDDVGLEEARDRLAYYPRDVWLYLLLCGWWRVHPEGNLVGRAGAVGDDLGSSVIASGLVSDLMRLAFLMERQYAPYSKWFGTAFARLPCGPELTPLLREVGRAADWQGRETALMAAYERLIALHNGLGLTAPLVPEVVRMWDRPFRVAWADVPDLLHPLIEDPQVLAIAERWPVGPVDRLRELLVPVRNRRLLGRILE